VSGLVEAPRARRQGRAATSRVGGTRRGPRRRRTIPAHVARADAREHGRCRAGSGSAGPGPAGSGSARSGHGVRLRERRRWLDARRLRWRPGREPARRGRARRALGGPRCARQRRRVLDRRCALHRRRCACGCVCGRRCVRHGGCVRRQRRVRRAGRAQWSSRLHRHDGGCRVWRAAVRRWLLLLERVRRPMRQLRDPRSRGQLHRGAGHRVRRRRRLHARRSLRCRRNVRGHRDRLRRDGHRLPRLQLHGRQHVCDGRAHRRELRRRRRDDERRCVSRRRHLRRHALRGARYRPTRATTAPRPAIAARARA
jgi:hypothetical protein